MKSTAHLIFLRDDSSIWPTDCVCTGKREPKTQTLALKICKAIMCTYTMEPVTHTLSPAYPLGEFWTQTGGVVCLLCSHMSMQRSIATPTRNILCSVLRRTLVLLDSMWSMTEEMSPLKSGWIFNWEQINTREIAVLLHRDRFHHKEKTYTLSKSHPYTVRCIYMYVWKSTPSFHRLYVRCGVNTFQAGRPYVPQSLQQF